MRKLFYVEPSNQRSHFIELLPSHRRRRLFLNLIDGRARIINLKFVLLRKTLLLKVDRKLYTENELTLDILSLKTALK